MLIGVTLAAHWFLYFVTIKLSSVAVAVLMAYLAPIAIALLAPFVLPDAAAGSRSSRCRPQRARPGRARWGGGRSGSAARARHGLFTAATYAALVLMTKRIVSDVPVLTLSFWNYAIAAVAISPLLLDAERVIPTANELPAVLALGVVFTALSGYLYIWSLRHVTAQTIGILAYIEPRLGGADGLGVPRRVAPQQIVVGGVLVIAAGATVVFLEPEDAATPEVVPLGSRS